MFRHTPIADINTTREVEPAEINGSGKPVGGIEFVTTKILSITCVEITHATPPASKLANISFAFWAILISEKIRMINIIKITPAPKKPNSSQIIEKIKSLSAKGRYKYFCLDEKSPTPKSPPLPRLYSDWIVWNPSPCGDAQGSKNAISLWSLYGSIMIKIGTRHNAGTKIKAKYFGFTPPKNNIQSIVMPRHIVMLIFGSKITNTQKVPPTKITGSIVLKLFALSLFSEKWQAENSTSENFAISLGWKDSPNKFIHLFAP